jgi:hypothetical protein
MATKAATTQTLELPPIDIRIVKLTVVGDSPLIMHRWSEKARQQMRDKQMGKAATKKEFKNPDADFEEATYHLPSGGYGFPAVAFKASAVDAATQLSGVTKTYLRGAFHTIGEPSPDGQLVPIEGERTMREDMVRIGMGTADIRYRPEFWPWRALLVVRYNAKSLSLEQLVHLFNQGGFSTGIGEWRPQKDGNNGMFTISDVEEVVR